jgi:hypothetical protein
MTQNRCYCMCYYLNVMLKSEDDILILLGR